MEAFAHPFSHFEERKGLEKVQEMLSQEFLVWVVPSCGSVPRHQMWDVFTDPQLFIFPHTVLEQAEPLTRTKPSSSLTLESDAFRLYPSVSLHDF